MAHQYRPEEFTTGGGIGDPGGRAEGSEVPSSNGPTRFDLYHEVHAQLGFFDTADSGHGFTVMSKGSSTGRRFSLRLPGRTCKPITLWDNPVLRTMTTPVTVFDKEIRRLVDQLFETMYAIETGVGLAATQIGRTERVFVFDCHDGVVGHVINPVVESLGSDVQVGWEGCLSLPGINAETSRLNRCRVTGRDADGNDIVYDGEGLRARCFQHELDHLDGVLYIDHQPDAVRTRLEQEMRNSEWYGNLSLDPNSALYKRSQAGDDGDT